MDRKGAKFQCKQRFRRYRRAVYAGSGTTAGEHASRNALVTASPFTASRSVGELHRSWVKAAPPNGAEGPGVAPGLALAARPAHAGPQSHGQF